MTALLLDTHAYVWAVTAPQRLSADARAAIEDATTTVLVSAASAWEMAIKLRSGRWPEAEPLLRAHDQLCDRLGAEHRAMTSSDAITAGGLGWDHRDPFDRMLAAQALRSQSTLVTRDPVFGDLAGLEVRW